MNKVLSLSVAVVTMGLTACGGGGGGGAGVVTTPAALTTANQSSASQDVTSSVMNMVDSSGLAIGANTVSEGVLFAEAFSHLDRLPEYMANAVASASATGAVASQTVACGVSGTMVLSVNDADGNNVISAGDSVSLTLNSCTNTYGRMNGSVSYRIDSLSGTYAASAYNAGVTLTFNNLSLSANTLQVSLNGAISNTFAKTGTNALTETISTASFVTSATYAGVSRSRSISNFRSSVSIQPDSTYTYLKTTSVAGTIASNGFGAQQSVTFDTPAALVRRGTDSYPYTGQLHILGAGNSAIRLTALSASLVQVELDANGDGAYESSNNVAWNTLY